MSLGTVDGICCPRVVKTVVVTQVTTVVRRISVHRVDSYPFVMARLLCKSMLLGYFADTMIAVAMAFEAELTKRRKVMTVGICIVPRRC